MQEEVEMRTVTMAFHASKFSGRVMKNGIAKLLHAMHGKLTVPHGKETIILFNEGEDTAHIQTYNAGLRKRLAAFSKKHPDLCRLEKSFAQGGVIYVLDKSRLSIRLQAPYSEERRRKASESAKQTWFKSRTE